ncbi:hypothetical protein L1887_15125 [Cichorium endivia]|nr:hypothetical protein L1887_15125 [Cichorium endivia]
MSSGASRLPAFTKDTQNKFCVESLTYFFLHINLKKGPRKLNPLLFLLLNSIFVFLKVFVKMLASASNTNPNKSTKVVSHPTDDVSSLWLMIKSL